MCDTRLVVGEKLSNVVRSYKYATVLEKLNSTAANKKLTCSRIKSFVVEPSADVC